MSYSLIATLQDFFLGFSNLLANHIVLTVLLLVGLAAWVRFDPKPAARGAQFAVLGVLVFLQAQVLSSLSQTTLERFDDRHNALYATAADQAGDDTVQYAPSASYQELSTREETLMLSNHALQIEGLSALPGWNGIGLEPSQHILAVRDRLEETPHATLVRRSIDFQRYLPLALESSLMTLALDFVPNSVAYQAKFSALYTFQNPLPTKSVLRFTFPLPDDSGTLQNFEMLVNGKRCGTEWEGEVEPQGKVEVKVSYDNRGRRSWSYSPTHRREAIGNLSLALTSDNSRIVFRKDSLFPQSQDSGSWDWNLQNVITSQDISLFFPTTPKKELVEKTLSFAPLGSLLYLAALALTMGPRPRVLLPATLAYGGGVVLASYLWTFFSFEWGLFWGGTVGCLLGLWICGRQGLSPVLLGWLTWLAFGCPGYTGLLLTSLGLLLLLWWAWRGPEKSEGTFLG